MASSSSLSTSINTQSLTNNNEIDAENLLTAHTLVSVSRSPCMDSSSLWMHTLFPLSETFNHVYYDNLSPSLSPYNHNADFTRILTPYSADTFNFFLCQANLSHEFPELPFKLCHSFSLGKF
ncbi:hypothetical protein BS17DRAFT_790666 [Gyrodon lividus]|nr:hypothetical protein BS17DRAFT_790666 [Gyrodon lividus]